MTKTNNKKTDTRTMKRDKNWLRSPDQRKRAKIFTVNMMQLPDGRFHLLGNGAKVLTRQNSTSIKEYPIDVRDLATEIRLNGVTSF